MMLYLILVLVLHFKTSKCSYSEFVFTSVSETKNRNEEINTLENEMNIFEENLINNKSYLKSKCDLNYIYDLKLEGIKMTSKYNWHLKGILPW